MFYLGIHPIKKMGKLAVFAGVAEFPIRVKCAILAWHTMHSALNDEDKVVRRKNETTKNTKKKI